MATYTISTLNKKSSECRDFWFKDGMVAIRTEGFRWATYTIESDTVPEVDLENPDGFEPLAYEWELVSMDDGCYGGWEWPDDMPESERERLEALYDEEWYEGLEGEGWVQDDSEVWLYGPLVMKNQWTGEEWSGEDHQMPITDSETMSKAVDEFVNGYGKFVEDMSDDEWERFGKESDLTDWFPADIDPVRVGRYELQFNNVGAAWPFPTYGDWDGKKWTQAGKAVKNMTGWRGLAKDPYAK